MIYFLNLITYYDYLIFLIVTCLCIFFFSNSNISIKGTLSVFFAIIIFYIYLEYNFKKQFQNNNDIENIITQKPILTPLKSYTDLINFFNEHKYLEQYDVTNFNQSIKHTVSFIEVYNRITKNSSLKYYQFDILQKHYMLSVKSFKNLQFNIPNQKSVLIEFEKSINNLNHILSNKLYEVVNFLESNNTELNIYSKVDFFNKIKPYNLFKKI